MGPLVHSELPSGALSLNRRGKMKRGQKKRKRNQWEAGEGRERGGGDMGGGGRGDRDEEGGARSREEREPEL